jgi:hypothetical protein
MPLLYPDLLVHSNPNNALVDSNFIKGATRSAVSTLTELYQLSAKGEAGSLGQLKSFATRVWVTSEGKYFTLTNEASARNASGWATDNQMLSAVLNSGTFDTTAKFVSASDGDLNTGYIPKATNAAGLDKSLIYDDGTNVGIGETSPEGKLHVKSGSSGSVTAQPNSVGIFENSNNSYISVLSPNSQYAGLVMGGPGNPYGSYVSWNHDNNALKVATAHSGGAIQLLVNAEQEAVRILSGGNVGIGTINPKEKLTVSGNISASGTATIGTIATNDINTSFVVESNGLLQKRTLNIAAGNTTAVFVSASDGSLTINRLTKATNSNGINESIISDNGSLVYVGGNLTISGNLTALGNAYFANTVFTTTSAISVVNTGIGPALYVYQGPGTSDVASFYDGDGIEVLHIGNCHPGDQFGKIGINTGDPNKELTVKGSVSASGTMNLGTVDTNASSTSFVVLGTDNILQKRSINSAATDTTSRFVSASDGDLSVNYLTKATNSNGINESIVYDDGTNVGIGTTSPTQLLDVNGNIAFGIGNGTSSGSGTIKGNLPSPVSVRQEFGTDDTGWQYRIAKNNAGTITDLVTLSDSGNVGIGTTSPSEKLDISGNLKTSGTATIGTLNTGTADSVLIESSGLLQKRSIDSRAWGSSLVDGTGTTNYVAKWSDGNTIANSQIFDNGTNVGIGTSSPTAKLNVVGGDIQLDNTKGLYWAANSDWAKIYFESTGDLEGQSKLVLETWDNADEPIVFRQSGSDRMYIGSGGNVGIGTSSPSEKLDVSGNLKTSGTATIGTLNTGTGTSIIIESSGLLQKRTLNAAAFDTTSIFVSASDGALTVNRLTKATNSNGINESIVTDDGSLVTINGNLSASGVFYVGANYIGGGGRIYYKDDSTTARWESGILGYASERNWSIYETQAGQSRLTVSTGGNVGIGTSSPGVKLDVVGVIRSNSNTVTPAATTALPSSNDVILNNQTGPVTITAFSNGVAGVTYTITNKSTHAVTLDTSASLFVRGGNSWASHKCTTNSEGYIVLPQNFSCSLRMDSATIGSAW